MSMEGSVLAATRPMDVARPSDIDVRAFTYALEPVRQKHQWHLDSLLADLSRIQQALADAEERRTAVADRSAREAASAIQALARRFDPVSHQRRLVFLAELRSQWTRIGEECVSLRAERESLRQACVAQQLRVEGLARHQAQELEEFAHEARRRLASEQDRDWLARSASNCRGRRTS